MVNEIAEILLWLAGIATALLSIGKLMKVVIKSIKKVIAFFHSLRTDMDILRRHEEENYKATLRLVIMSEEMPIEERLDAGEKYVKLGGNGTVKAKYKQLQAYYTEEVCSHSN